MNHTLSKPLIPSIEKYTALSDYTTYISFRNIKFFCYQSYLSIHLLGVGTMIVHLIDLAVHTYRLVLHSSLSLPKNYPFPLPYSKNNFFAAGSFIKITLAQIEIVFMRAHTAL